MKLKKPLTIEQAKRILLYNCPDNQRVIGSGDLLEKSGLGEYGTDNLRAAYWSLVSDGLLIRIPEGVYRNE